MRKTLFRASGLLFIYALFVAAAAIVVWTSFGGFSAYGWKKMALSSGFLLVAALGGPGKRPYGRWLLAGLACGWWGDFLLIGPGDRFFLAGAIAFGLGHLAYCAAFWSHGARRKRTLAVFPVLLAAGLALLWWLWPGIPALLRWPMLGYTVSIALMTALAAGCLGLRAGWLIALGALLFFLSDFGIALREFSELRTRAVYVLMVLYMPGQYLLAASIFATRRL